MLIKVSLGRVRLTIVAVESNKYYIFCVCVCVLATLIKMYAQRLHHFILSSEACLALSFPYIIS